MKILSLFGAGILSLAIAPTAIASEDMFQNGRGEFSDGRWSIYQECGVGTYVKNANKSIALSGAPQVAYESGKKVSIWNKSGTKYRTIWNPKDPNFVRLQVINDRGRTISNRLLKVGKYPPC